MSESKLFGMIIVDLKETLKYNEDSYKKGGFWQARV